MSQAASTHRLKALLRNYHRGEFDRSDDEIDRSIGLRRLATENRLSFSDLILHYGHHRVETGDFPYRIIRSAFKRLEQYRWKSLLDIGSGYGRVLFYGALVFDRRCCGIELVDERAMETRRVTKALGLPEVTVRQADVTRAAWPEADCYFLMNSALPEYLPELARRLDTIAREKEILVVSHSTANLHICELPSLMEIDADPDEGSYGLRTFRSRQG